MIPTLKNLLKFFPRTYWLSPQCFRESVTILLKKPRKSARETRFLVLFKLEFKFLQEC